MKLELLQRADAADGVVDNVVNLDSRKARAVLGVTTAGGRIPFDGPALPEPADGSEYDDKMAKRFHVEQPNMGRQNCVASSALSLLKAAGVEKRGTDIYAFTKRLAQQGVLAREMTRGDELKKYNATLSGRQLVDIDHDAAMRRLNRGEVVMAWTDLNYGGGERMHVVTIYRNPISGKIMVLDPLYAAGSNYEVTMDGTDDFKGRLSRLSLRQRYMAVV